MNASVVVCDPVLTFPAILSRFLSHIPPIFLNNLISLCYDINAGGYNFMNCWGTGHVAGTTAATETNNVQQQTETASQ
jgi:hypothetical protein